MTRERYQNLPGEKWEYACHRYSNLPEDGKEEKQQYGCKQYKNLPEDERKIMWL